MTLLQYHYIYLIPQMKFILVGAIHTSSVHRSTAICSRAKSAATTLSGTFIQILGSLLFFSVSSETHQFPHHCRWNGSQTANTTTPLTWEWVWIEIPVNRHSGSVYYLSVTAIQYYSRDIIFHCLCWVKSLSSYDVICLIDDWSITNVPCSRANEALWDDISSAMWPTLKKFTPKQNPNATSLFVCNYYKSNTM